jgi:hypothetical protein
MSDVKALLAANSSYYFTTTYFKNIDDPNLFWTPFSIQKTIYNVVDYGYDLSTKVIKPQKLPKYIVLVLPRQWGKTTGIASLVACLLIRYPGCKIGVMSNKDENAKKFIEKVAMFIKYSQYSALVDTDRKSTLSLRFPLDLHGIELISTVESFGETENIRSNSYTWLILDEIAQSSEEIIKGAAFPTTRFQGNYRKNGKPDTILISTPRGAKGTFAEYFKIGIKQRRLGCKACLTTFERKELPDEVDYYGFKPKYTKPCPKCAKVDYEFVDGPDVAVVNVDPWSHPIYTPEILRQELDLAGWTPLARQEYLGEFIEDGAGVYYDDWLKNCVDETLTLHPPKGGVVSIDFGRNHDATVIMAGHRANGTYILEDIKYIPSIGGIEYNQIRYELLMYVCEVNPYLLVPDATGIGDAVVEDIYHDLITLRSDDVHGFYIRDGIRTDYTINCKPDLRTTIWRKQLKSSTRIDKMGIVFEYNIKFEIIQHSIEVISTGKLKIPKRFSHINMQRLWEELINYGYEYSSNGRIIYGTQNGHDDTVIALAMLLYACNAPTFVKPKPKLGGRDTFVIQSLRKEEEIGFTDSPLGKQA